MTRGRMRPGDWAAVGLFSGGLSISAALIASGHEPTSTCVRTRFLARIVATYLWLHLCFDLRHDPIHLLGTQLDTYCRTRRGNHLGTSG